MSSVIDNFTRHKSERSFTGQPVDEALLERIISTAWLAPTSVNSQQVSVIVTHSAENRQKIAALAGGQPWIAKAPVFLTFVLDMYKSARAMALIDEQQIAHQSIESLVSGATDVGIALASVMASARAEGLGVVPIGGIRRSPLEMVKLLQLPEYTFPVAGVAMGYVDVPSHQKPRLPFSTFRHDETYQTAGLEENIAHYNQQINQHWRTIGRPDGESWSESVAGYYRHIYFPDVLDGVLKQGFGNDK